jgi:lipopolysaccharide/colanic/teichoic acid biosynthesis glycosyltransferase
MDARQCKRFIDLVLATCLIILCSPLLLATALAILLLEGWPVLYISRRYVSPTKTVPVVKFRTMVRDATSPRYRLEERFMRKGYLDIPRSCEVYTPIGRFLERTQIVELPQMFNVLFHGMSLIGNRPLPERNVKLLRQYEGWEKRFESPAGISGIAQVAGKLSLQPAQRLALEGAYSEAYRKGNIIKVDIVVLIYTLRVILFANGLPYEQAARLVGSAANLEATAPQRADTAAV